MDSDSVGVDNLFARITSFTAEIGSDRVENLCTEIFAWCLLKSDRFQQSFLKLAGASEIHEPEISTQFAVEVPNLDQPPGRLGRGFCDLVVLPTNRRGVALVVELKVWSKFRRNQLADYRAAVSRRWAAIKPRMVTVTPFLERPVDSDCHITWSMIFEILERIEKSQDTIVFSQFAAFLKLRGMSKAVVIDKIDAKAVNGLRTAAERVQQFNNLFALLALDKSLKGIFSPRDFDRPKFEYDDASRAWFGVYCNGMPWYYAGVAALPKGFALMVVQVAIEGDRLRATLPTSLKESFACASQYADKLDNWANVGRLETEGRVTKTYFTFAAPIDEEYNAQPQKIRTWFTSILLAAQDFAESLK